MNGDAANRQTKRPRTRAQKLVLLGIGALALFPVAGLVMTGYEKIQDAGDRTK